MTRDEFFNVITDYTNNQNDLEFLKIYRDTDFHILQETAWIGYVDSKIKIWNQRKKSVSEINKKIIGIDNLLKNLKTLDKNDKIDYFELRSENYIGECILYNNKILGYAITNRNTPMKRQA